MFYLSEKVEISSGVDYTPNSTCISTELRKTMSGHQYTNHQFVDKKKFLVLT